MVIQCWKRRYVEYAVSGFQLWAPEGDRHGNPILIHSVTLEQGVTLGQWGLLLTSLKN